MSGGIKRKAHYVRSLGPRAIYLESGAQIRGTSRQDVIKAETLAESFASMGARAVAIGPTEFAAGAGLVLTMNNLSKGAVLSSDGTFGAPSGVRDLGELEVIVAGPADASLPPASEKPRVILFDGGLSEAKSSAAARSQPALIVFQSQGDPVEEPTVENGVTYVSPGDKGRTLISLTLDGRTISSFQRITLGPEVPDDPQVKRLYQTYLNRITTEDLLGKSPRTSNAAFVGSKACASCHGITFQKWKTTKHADAYHSIEAVGHGRDPDCVSCHVVGVSSTKGFLSRAKTPGLANVGCESCHGAGRNHAKNPKKFKLSQGGERTCLSCHTPENSPNFAFQEYWKRIQHR